MKRVLVFGLLMFSLLFPLLLRAQEKSKKMYSSRTSKEQQSVVAVLRQAEDLSLKDPKAAFDMLATALATSVKENDQLAEALCYQTIGLINYRQQLHTRAIDSYQKSFVIFQTLQQSDYLYELRKLMADAFEGSLHYARALEEWNKVLAEAQKRNNQDDVVKAKDKLAGIYEKQGKLELALQNQRDALAIERSRGNQKGVISQGNKVGELYVQQNKLDEALSHFNTSQSVATEISDINFIAETSEKIGKVYRKEKNYEAELDLRRKAIAMLEKENQPEALNSEYLEMGRIFLAQQEPAAAIPYFRQSMALSEVLANPGRQAEAYRGLSESFSQLGRFPDALLYYKNYVSLMDTLHKQREKTLAGMLKFNEELSESQKMIESLEKDMQLSAKTIELLRNEQKLKEEGMKTQATIIYALLAGLMVVFAASYLLHKSSQKRRIANQLLALKSLRSQMNPHFIFNALNSVNSFISQNDERSANKYLSEFSRLMRAVMENSQMDFVPLATEIRILELYLSLEHFRFKDRFDYVFEVDEHFDAEAVQIPPMLIQPYIENAIWHGLRYKEEKGFLQVKIRAIGRELLVCIEDNGIGRKKSQELKTHHQKETISTGLKNIESRLKIINEIHKTRLTVSIHDLDPESQTGTKVEIKIPLKVEEPELV